MKLDVLSESPSDEAAVRILVDAILGEQSIRVSSLQRPPGWPAVRQFLPTVMKHLHYRTDADALVVVVDSDNSPIHEKSHDLPEGSVQECRVCQLRATIIQVQIHLRSVSGRASIKTAVGLAVPAVEAWYLCGIDLHCTEASLMPRLGAGAKALKNQLKKEVYSTDRPLREMQTKRATEEAIRLAQDLNLIERLFPQGFGSLARDVRNWQQG